MDNNVGRQQTFDRPTLNPALRDFWMTSGYPIKILKGGRDSTKSWDAAGFAIFLASNYRIKFLCLRQFQNRIDDSVYTLLKSQIERFGLDAEFTILKNGIEHNVTGSSFHFFGFQRHTKQIKSFEGADVCWIEEADGLTEAQFLIINPTIRKEAAELWLTYNPQFESDFVESELQHREDALVRHINYDENPFLSTRSANEIAQLKASDYGLYEHVYRGKPLRDGDAKVINMAWIEAAIDAHIKLDVEPTGRDQIGYDIADGGADRCATVGFKGLLACTADEWHAGEDELEKSGLRVYNAALESKAHVVYDSIGIGAQTGAYFNSLNDARENERLIGTVGHSKFNAGGKVEDPDEIYPLSDEVKNKDYFANIKAQSWWRVADRFRNTFNAIHNGASYEDQDLIAISSDLPHLKQLKKELATPFRDFDKLGRVKVESKDDLARREVPSPNLADAFIMGASTPPVDRLAAMYEAFVVA